MSRSVWRGVAALVGVCGVMAWGVGAAVAEPADYAMQFGVDMHGGGALATYSYEEAALGEVALDDPELGYGFGAQLHFTFGLAPGFALGVCFDYSLYVHEDEQQGAELTFNHLLPSLGLYLRSDFDPRWGVAGWANFVFGESTVEFAAPQGGLGSGSAAVDAYGLAAGLKAVRRFEVQDYGTFFELGLYGSFEWLSQEGAASDLERGQPGVPASDAYLFQVGALIAATFDFDR